MDPCHSFVLKIIRDLITGDINYFHAKLPWAAKVTFPYVGSIGRERRGFAAESYVVNNYTRGAELLPQSSTPFH